MQKGTANEEIMKGILWFCQSVLGIIILVTLLIIAWRLFWWFVEVQP